MMHMWLICLLGVGFVTFPIPYTLLTNLAHHLIRNTEADKGHAEKISAKNPRE